MSTPSTPSLDELELALNAAVGQMQRLSADNARLRGELAAANERMRAAGQRLRLAALRLPQAAASDALLEAAA